MEKILEKPEEAVVETPTEAEEVVETTEPVEEVETQESPEAETDSSSQEEDLSALIEEEKKHGKPDPQKAANRFIKKSKPLDEDDDEDEEVEEEDRPLTRRELEAILTERQHQTLLETQSEQINQISESLAESPLEAELIRSIHANRVFPPGMSIREQLTEAQAIANIKRDAAKKAEMARKIASQNNVSRNTATTQRDAQAGTEPKVSADLKLSLKRAGYAYNGTSKRYEKKLPNGKMLVKNSATDAPYLVG